MKEERVSRHSYDNFRRQIIKNKIIIQKKFEMLFEDKQTRMDDFIMKLYGGNKYVR